MVTGDAMAECGLAWLGRSSESSQGSGVRLGGRDGGELVLCAAGHEMNTGIEVEGAQVTENLPGWSQTRPSM